jgi:hypothetical protein
MDGRPNNFEGLEETIRILASMSVSVVFIGVGGDIEFNFADM